MSALMPTSCRTISRLLTPPGADGRRVAVASNRLAHSGDRVQRRKPAGRLFGSAPAFSSAHCQLEMPVFYRQQQRIGGLDRPDPNRRSGRIGSLISHPAASSRKTTSLRPSRTAKKRGVKPEGSGVRKSAAASSSASTTSICPSAAAHISAVCPLTSLALTSAPRADQRLHRTQASGPRRRHQHRLTTGQCPRRSAPAASNSSTISALPLVHAIASGVTP